MDIIRTILIILIVYYSIRFISRLLVPILIRMFVKRAQRNFGQQFEYFQQKKKSQKEGELSIDSKNKNKSNVSKPSLGEYVDFEELED